MKLTTSEEHLLREATKSTNFTDSTHGQGDIEQSGTVEVFTEDEKTKKEKEKEDAEIHIL